MDNLEKDINVAHKQQMENPQQANFANRKFLKQMLEISRIKCNVEDFLDDRVPAINTNNFDQELLSTTPRGIKSDKDMEGAWMFAQYILNRANIPQMKPYEIILEFQNMNDQGLKMQKLARFKRAIKAAKKEGNTEEVTRLKVEYDEFEKTIHGGSSWSAMQRQAITQVVLVIGFIKEYVSVRAVKIENAEESPVFVPCYKLTEGEEYPCRSAYFDDTEKILYICKGNYVFYANPVEAINNTTNVKTPYYIPIIKKLFSRDVRVGNDRDDSITVTIPDDFKIGYMETEPISIDKLTAMIEASKPTTLETSKVEEVPVEEVIIPEIVE